MKKKFLSAVLATAMLATTLTGCGESADKTTEATTTAATEAGTTAADAGSADDGAAYDECTITFDWWGGDSRHEATQAAVEAFEAKYPGINVEINFGAWSDWETAKAAEYLSGNNPDVQQTNFDWIGKYDADGTTYLDLNTVSDYLDLTQYDEATLAKCVDSKGGQAGIPVSVTGRTFYWNEATFQAAGLSVPTNMEELMAAGPVFKEKLGDNYYPLVIGEYDRAILVAYYLQKETGKPIIDENNQLTVTQDQLKKGLEFIKSLEDAHVIPTIPYVDGEGADSMDKSQRFINGEYAGIFEWDSSPAKYVSALGDNGDDLVVGNVFPELQSYSKVSLMFSISAETEHPRECAMLLNYLLNDPEGAAIMASERGIPESKAAYEVVNAAGKINPLSAQAHEEVMGSNPLFWNPLFDSKVLKGDTSVYTTVFEQFSYGMDASGASYDVDKAAADLYQGYMDAVAQ